MPPDRSQILKPFAEAELYDPIGEATRTERKHLLVASLLCLAVTWSDFIPERISALGIVLEPEDQTSFVVLLGLTLAYFAVAFATCALADLARWRVLRRVATYEASSSVQPFYDLLGQDGRHAGSGDRFDARRVREDIDLGKTALRSMGLRLTFDLGAPPLVAVSAAASVVAELVDLDSPLTLLALAWFASRSAFLLLLSLFALALWRALYSLNPLVRHHTQHWAILVAHRVIRLGLRCGRNNRTGQALVALGTRLLDWSSDVA